jgi:dihydrofolate reductase
VTYDIFAGYWPNQPDDDPFARTMNEKPTYVVSTTLTEPLSWQNSTLIRDDVAGSIRRLKADDGGDIMVIGSGGLVQTLIGENLVDVYQLMIHPIVLGKGKRLFRSDLDLSQLELID